MTPSDTFVSVLQISYEIWMRRYVNLKAWNQKYLFSWYKVNKSVDKNKTSSWSRVHSSSLPCVFEQRFGKAAVSSDFQALSALPLTVISLIFLVFSSIHFSRRIFSVALIRSFNFLISCWARESGRGEGKIMVSKLSATKMMKIFNTQAAQYLSF